MNWKTFSITLAALFGALFLGGCSVVSRQTAQPTPIVTVLPAAATDAPPVIPPTETAVQPVVTPEPIQTQAPVSWVAFVGVDGNIRLVNGSSLEQVQVTHDAAGYSTTGENIPVVVYQGPQWSSDGMLLAYERQDGTPIAAGFTFQFSLWVYDLASGQTKPVLQNEQVAGFDWKPGTHQIAFGQAIDLNYFAMHATDPTYAKGLRLVDVDSGAMVDLVSPERGFHLAAPEWSPNGQFLSFQEVYLMEGTGKFAIYDLAAARYIAWDESIGSYTWSHDSEAIIYDTMTYVAQGNEAIYTRPRAGGEAVRISPEITNGYSYSPASTPGGEMLAFLADMDGMDLNNASLYVIEAPGSDPRHLGSFENASFLSWSAGWTHILMSSGPWDNSQILLISPYDGSVTVLAQGSQPDWNPAAEIQ